MMNRRWVMMLGVGVCLVQPAFSMGRRPPGEMQPIKNSVQVTSVELSDENASAGPWQNNVSCQAFTGTHAGNTITIQARGVGGDGDYHHTLIYTLSDAYELKNKEPGQRMMKRDGNGEFELKLPELRPNVPFVDQPLLLMTQDGAGHVTTSSISFRVSRPVILQPSSDARSMARNCYQRYLPYESSVGVLSNGSTNPSDVTVTQGINKLWTSSHGWQWGVWVSPFTKWLDILTLEYSHFSEVSKQTSETVEVSSSYHVNPGDYMQMYVQPTRYVTAYDATLVSPCGQSKTERGVYLFQWWGFAYHLFPVNPLDPTPPPAASIGAPVANTCPKILDPSVSRGENAPYDFWRTNP